MGISDNISITTASIPTKNKMPIPAIENPTNLGTLLENQTSIDL